MMEYTTCGIEHACKFNDHDQVGEGYTTICGRKDNGDDTYTYENKCMKNSDLNELMFDDDGDDGQYKKDYYFSNCGCCDVTTMAEEDKLKNGDAEYCINGPAICTPDDDTDGSSSWSPCDKKSNKSKKKKDDGKVEMIEVCVTDTTIDESETVCVDPFDDIFYYTDDGYTVECGPCRDIL